MKTRDELWRWTRRLDEAFGVRVLTVEVTKRGSVAAEAVVSSLFETDEADHEATEADYTGAVMSSFLFGDNADDSTVATIEPLSIREWSTFAERFLFLLPSSDSFRSTDLGELLLDERLKGQLYVKGIWIADMAKEYALGSGLNLTHLRLDRDRRAVVHASDLESQAAALWVRAIEARPSLASRVLELMSAPSPGADVRKVAEFLSGKRAVADLIASEWFEQHGGDALPVAQGDASKAGFSISALEARLNKRLVVVNASLLEVLAQASSVSSIKALEDELLEREAKQDAPKPVAWASLSEDARRVAHNVASILQQAGDEGFEVGLLDVLDYGEKDPFGEARQRKNAAAAFDLSASPAASPPPAAEAPAAASAAKSRIAVPLACFDLDLVHEKLGGSGRPRPLSKCREAFLVKIVCRERSTPQLLDIMLQSLLEVVINSFAVHGHRPEYQPSYPFSDECSRRELLLRMALSEVEEEAATERTSQVSELKEMKTELQRLQTEMLKHEVDSVNEINRARAEAQAADEIGRERRRLEAAAEEARKERSEMESEVIALREELSHARAARTAAEAKAAAEREANARWQAHMEESLASTRNRLVGRTEQLMQIGVQLDGTRVEAVELEGGDKDKDKAVLANTVVESIANALREEREARLCAVCLRAERSTVLMPCRHAVLCATCATTVRESSGRCPLCRQGIEDVVKTFS